MQVKHSQQQTVGKMSKKLNKKRKKKQMIVFEALSKRKQKAVSL